MEKLLKYKSTYARNPGKGLIVRLEDGGYAIVRTDEKRVGLNIEISDYAMTFLKFDSYGHYKKVEQESDVPDIEKENARYNLLHGGTSYGEIRNVDTVGYDPW